MKAKQQELIYNTLLRAWQNEHKRIKINPIPNKASFEDLRDLIHDIKTSIASEKNPAVKNIYEKNIDIIQYMVSDLLDLREEKILKSSRELNRIDENILLDIEIPYYRQLLIAFKGYSKGKKMLVGGILRNGNLYKRSSPTSISEEEFVDKKVEPINSNETSKDQPNSFLNKNNNSESVSVPFTSNIETRSHDVNIEKQHETQNEKGGYSHNNFESSNQKVNTNNQRELSHRVNESINSHTQHNNKGDKLPTLLQIENFEYLTIRIKHSLQPIVGADMKIYGPLDPGSVVFMPKPNAEILIEEDIAVPIQFE